MSHDQIREQTKHVGSFDNKTHDGTVLFTIGDAESAKLQRGFQIVIQSAVACVLSSAFLMAARRKLCRNLATQLRLLWAMCISLHVQIAHL